MGVSKKNPRVAIPLDYSKLRGRIVEKFGKQGAFANAIGWSEKSVSEWLNNQKYWPHEAMIRAIRALEIPESDVGAYFFARLIQDS